MRREFYEKMFSEKRMSRYFHLHENNEQQALDHYHLNIQLSESFYTILSLFEVALRNSMNRELTAYFRTEDWYLRLPNTPGLKDLNHAIIIASRQITKRNELITADKIIPELTLGFWVRLLNAEYERILWKALKRSFPHLEKRNRQRRNVSAPINRIRNFRNRVFHFEPIAWNMEQLTHIHSQILLILSWINKDLPQLAAPFDRVPSLLDLTIPQSKTA